MRLFERFSNTVKMAFFIKAPNSVSLQLTRHIFFDAKQCTCAEEIKYFPTFQNKRKVPLCTYLGLLKQLSLESSVTKLLICQSSSAKRSIKIGQHNFFIGVERLSVVPSQLLTSVAKSDGKKQSLHLLSSLALFFTKSLRR